MSITGFKMFLYQIPFVFRLCRSTPHLSTRLGFFFLLWCFRANYLYGFGVGYTSKFIFKAKLSFSSRVISLRSFCRFCFSSSNGAGSKFNILTVVLQCITDHILQHFFGCDPCYHEYHKSHFRLYHQNSAVPCRIAVLSSEGGTKCVNIAKGHRRELALELTGYGKVRCFPEKSSLKINVPVFIFGRIGNIKVCNPERFARSLGIAGRNNGRMDV